MPKSDKTCMSQLNVYVKLAVTCLSYSYAVLLKVRTSQSCHKHCHDSCRRIFWLHADIVVQSTMKSLQSDPSSCRAYCTRSHNAAVISADEDPIDPSIGSQSNGCLCVRYKSIQLHSAHSLQTWPVLGL